MWSKMVGIIQYKEIMMGTLMAVSEAQNRILAKFEPVSVDIVALNQSHGRVLAEDQHSGMDLPPFNNSSMDGFALKATDVNLATQETPAELEVVSDVPAGMFPDFVLESGQAARIMTGAPVPEGAEAVAPLETTDQFEHLDGTGLPKSVKVYQAVNAGAYIRKKGEDVGQNEVVLRSNHKIRPQDIGLMASLGITQVPVYRRVKVALITSGDELVRPDQPLSPGKIRDANTSMFVALLAQRGIEANFIGIVPDDPAAVQECLREAGNSGPDLILSTAGVSVGVYDYIRQAIEEQGQLDFWRANMRPGKPIAFGLYKDIPFIGLPGNPVSAFVGYQVFVMPALDRLAGLLSTHRDIVRASLETPLESDGRETYLRVVLSKDGVGRWRASSSGHQGSGNLVALARGDGLAVIPAGTKKVEAGSLVDIWLI
jgi:molybdopterin molybdotransferase